MIRNNFCEQVVGALWYLFAIESELRCWNIACQRHNCYSKYLYCGEGRVGDFGFLKTSCPLLERNEIKDSTNFDFGLFLDALQTRVIETSDFRQKFLYCSWWGLQSLRLVITRYPTLVFSVLRLQCKKSSWSETKRASKLTRHWFIHKLVCNQKQCDELFAPYG